MRRRVLLSGLGTALAGATAGCGGGDGESSDGGSDDSGTPDSEMDTATPTPVETEAPIDTETPTETRTPTETSTPTPGGDNGESSFTHDVDEEFTVGESGNQVTYRIFEFTRADRIGSQINFSEADGTYLIVTLEVTNPRDEAFEFPRFDFRLQTDDGAWQRFDRQPSEKIESDGRIDVGHIGDDTFEPGASKIGAVAFDIDPEKTQRLWITPAGDAEVPEHFVPVGDLSEVEELGGY